MDEKGRRRGLNLFRGNPLDLRSSVIGGSPPPSEPPRCSICIVGVCKPCPGPGGWAYAGGFGAAAYEESGADPDTTELGMEVTAAIKGLTAAPVDKPIRLYTRSQALYHAMTASTARGQLQSEPLTEGQPAADRRLWEQLGNVAAQRTVSWEWLCADVFRSGTQRSGGEVSRHYRHAYLLAIEAACRAIARSTNADVADTGAREGSPEIHIESATVTKEEGRMNADDRGQPLTLHAERPGQVAQAHSKHVDGHKPRMDMQDIDDRRQALLAECQKLERRWAELHAQVARAEDEWRQLLDRNGRGVEAAPPERTPTWAEGALLFSDLATHAARLSSLAGAGLQVCNDYATTLRQALEAR